eukprot:Amastigsp_a1978_14.p3 type:complete len:146 gc:universal Amastigsp_a1978_14:459-22(-)
MTSRKSSSRSKTRSRSTRRRARTGRGAHTTSSFFTSSLRRTRSSSQTSSRSRRICCSRFWGTCSPKSLSTPSSTPLWFATRQLCSRTTAPRSASRSARLLSTGARTPQVFEHLHTSSGSCLCRWRCSLCALSWWCCPRWRRSQPL